MHKFLSVGMMHIMLRTLLIATVCLLLSACGGRVPVETIVHQVGDEGKSCPEIELELEYIEKEVATLLKDKDKTVRNLGLLALTTQEPLSALFMDLSLAEKRELSALKKRYNHLVRIAVTKECGPPPRPLEKVPENFHELMADPNPSGL